MKFRRHYICPFCFSRNSLYDVEFRCASDPKRCPPEPDQAWSDFRGIPAQMKRRIVQISRPTNIFKRVISLLKMPKEAICSNCNEKTSERVCPDCHSELPYTTGDFKDLIFSVIGAKEAGKSHYISVLLHKIMNEIGAGYDCNLQPLNDGTMKRYRSDFHNPIFRKKEIIQATRSARTDFSVRIPLIYTLSFMGRGLFGKIKVRHAVTIVFFDTAGEDLDDENTMATENRYICNSSGIIFLLDPLQLPDVRANLAGTPLPNENTEAEDLLARTANLIRKTNNLKADQRIGIPVAVAFSKIDALDSTLDPSTCLNYPSRHTNLFDIGDFEDVNSEMESLLKEWSGDYLVQQLKHNFKEHAFFGLTSLGCNPHGSQKISKLRPRRVEDPFLWLLWKHKLVKDNRKSLLEWLKGTIQFLNTLWRKR